jgi:hypothetical protein
MKFLVIRAGYTLLAAATLLLCSCASPSIASQPRASHRAPVIATASDAPFEIHSE